MSLRLEIIDADRKAVIPMGSPIPTEAHPRPKEEPDSAACSAEPPSGRLTEKWLRRIMEKKDED